MSKPGLTGGQVGCSILDQLEGHDITSKEISREGVALIQTGDEERLDEELGGFLYQEIKDTPYIMEEERAGSGSGGYMWSNGEMVIKGHPKIIGCMGGGYYKVLDRQ